MLLRLAPTAQRAAYVPQLQGAVQIYTAGVAKATLRMKIKPQRRRCGAYDARSDSPD